LNFSVESTAVQVLKSGSGRAGDIELTVLLPQLLGEKDNHVFRRCARYVTNLVKVTPPYGDFR